MLINQSLRFCIVYPKFKTDELIKKHLKFKPNEYTKNEAKIFV